jgi:transposase
VGAGQQVHFTLEETGIYSRALATFLHEAGHHVSLVNPERPKRHGQSRGCRTKTDRVDAWLLADYTLRQQPERWVPLAPQHEKLRALVRRRQQLLKLRQQELNHVEGTLDPLIKESARRVAAHLARELTRVEREMDAVIQSDPRLSHGHHLLSTIPGLGPLSAALLLGELPPLDGFENARQLCAYAGLTPRQRESGTSVRGRSTICKQGRRGLRTVLHMPALVARRHCPPLRQFAERLLANGKTKKAVLSAVARKLLALAFAILRSGKEFNPLYANPLNALHTTT